MMQIITINIPRASVKALDRLVELQHFPSRSEAIRTAIRDFFLTEVQHSKYLLEAGADTDLVQCTFCKMKRPAAEMAMHEARCGHRPPGIDPFTMPTSEVSAHEILEALKTDMKKEENDDE